MPKAPEEDKPREVFLSVRMLPEEKAEAEEMAKEDSLSTSRFVRHLLHYEKMKRRGHTSEQRSPESA